MNKFVIIGIVLVAIIGGVFLLSNRNTSKPLSSETTEEKEVMTKNGEITFQNPKKSAHYESNTPAHGAILAGVPTNVVIDFNFDLAKPSSISIEKDGKDYGVGETVIDANKLAMRRTLAPNATDGLYTISYKACWPDGSCHDGNFQFAIDKSKAQTYTDFRDQKEVSVKLSEIKFQPQSIRISKGTKVTWTNDDSVGHFVNTDSHPAHTHYPNLNSKLLNKGDVYSFTFNDIGAYPYHCSAHADVMTATILVE